LGYTNIVVVIIVIVITSILVISSITSSIVSSILASSYIIVIITTVTIIVIIGTKITPSAVISTVAALVEQDSVWLACATIYEFGHGIIQCELPASMIS